MNSIVKAAKHFAMICRHKAYVAYYCFAAGLYRQGITHDLSKFSPTEFFESVHYFSGTESPILAAKADKGYSMCWQHHKGRNKHHYEYWQDNFDTGGTPLKMPFEYALELVCDYLGAGRAYIGDDFSFDAEYEWWMNKTSKPIAMHPHTKAFVNELLVQLKESNDLSVLKKENARVIYHMLQVCSP